MSGVKLGELSALPADLRGLWCAGRADFCRVYKSKTIEGEV